MPHTQHVYPPFCPASQPLAAPPRLARALSMRRPQPAATVGSTVGITHQRTVARLPSKVVVKGVPVNRSSTARACRGRQIRGERSQRHLDRYSPLRPIVPAVWRTGRGPKRRTILLQSIPEALVVESPDRSPRTTSCLPPSCLSITIRPTSPPSHPGFLFACSSDRRCRSKIFERCTA